MAPMGQRGGATDSLPGGNGSSFCQRPVLACCLGDGWQPIVQRPPAELPPDELRDKIAALCELAEAGGRDPQTIITALGASVHFSEGASASCFGGSPQHIAEGIRRYQVVGVQDFCFDFPSSSPDGSLQAMERFAAEVRPQVG